METESEPLSGEPVPDLDHLYDADIRHRIVQIVFIVLLVAPLFAAAWYSVSPSGSALWGAFSLGEITINRDMLSDDEQILATRRKIQSHFLNFDTYVPLEDILVTGRSEDIRENLVFLMRKTCGKGNIYVWVPLRIKLPVVGDRVFEWCWKPKVKLAKTTN